jgi:hypothetical protein
MFSQTLAEEEEELEEAQKAPILRRINTLKERIKNNDGSKPAEIRSDKYYELGTQELDEVFESISDNPNINKIEVGVIVSENAAARMVRSFLEIEQAEELKFNILGRVNHPSQWRLMQTQADFEEQVDNHNAVQKSREQNTLLFLTGMHAPSRKRLRQENPAAPPALPVEILRDKLKPTIESKRKRLIAE